MARTLPVPRWGAEGVRESWDPTAKCHPGGGDVPRGNGAGLANASGKNAGMRLSVFPSAPWPLPDTAPRPGLLRPPEDAGPSLGRGFAGGAQSSCLRAGGHVGMPGHAGDAAFGVLPGWVAALGWTQGVQDSPAGCGLFNKCDFPQDTWCVSGLKAEAALLREREGKLLAAAVNGDDSERRGGVSGRAPAPREPVLGGDVGRDLRGGFCPHQPLGCECSRALAQWGHCGDTLGTLWGHGADTATSRAPDSRGGSRERPQGAAAAPTAPPAPHGSPSHLAAG